MDDQFLYDLRRDPPPEFAQRLRASIGHKDAAVTEGDRLGRRFAKWASMAASIALVSLAFTLPSVRAGAQAFLDLFRVENVVGISFDAERLRDIDMSGLDLPRMLGGQMEVLTEPSPPASFGTPEDASTAAGIRVLEPAWMPVGWERAAIEVSGEHAFRVSASTTNLQELLEQLGVDDLSIPAELDGKTAAVRVPPVVRTTYRNGDQEVHLMQARTPQVSFPAELDLAGLAEIGLRVLGVDREEAGRLAHTIDWRTTLLVPVPMNAATFRDVNVAGNDGLMIEPERRRGPNLLLWASDDKVYAIGGALPAADLLEMAQTSQ